MKKVFFVCVFFFAALLVFAQKRPVVAVLPFEAGDGGVSAAEAAAFGEQLLTELRSWDAVDLVSDAGSAEYVVKGRLERVNNNFVLSAVTSDARTGRTLNNAVEQASAQTELSSRMFSFAAHVTENVPFPNYLLGKWQAIINLNDGPLVCILEFLSDRILRVERFDTWEHREGKYALRLEGSGTGTYSFWGHARRTIRGNPVDGFVTVNVPMEDVLIKYAQLSYSRINFYFNESKTVFELVDGGFGCGDNYSGPSVYPSAVLSYVTFTKIQ